MDIHLKKLSKTRWVFSLAILFGLMQAILFDFSYDSPRLWTGYACSIISLVGVLAIIQHLTPKRAILFGYLFGLAFFGWGLNWIYISMATFGGAPLVFAIFSNGAVVAYLSLYWLAGTYLIVKLGKTPNQRLFLAPAVIALLEWVRSVFLIGFPWLSLGYSWVDTKFAHIASYAGVFGLTFCVVCLMVLLLKSLRYPIRLVIIMTVIVFSLQSYNFTSPYLYESKSAKVSLIQGNIPVITKYNDKNMIKNLAQFHVLTEPVLIIEKPDIVIWPEAAIPFFYVESGDFLNDMFALQQKHQFDLITGIPHGNWETRDIYNSVLLQKANDQKPQFYNKSHLLPFGEYLPFRSIFSFFKDIVDIPMSDFARGQAVQEHFETGGLTFSPNICFEAVFGDDIRKSAKNSDILLNVSNDAWFGQSKAQIQHLNISRIRAIENQKMMVRATNDGRTAIIGTDGEILKSIEPFKEGTLTATVYSNNVETLYMKVGDWLVIILSFLMIAPIILFRIANMKKTASNTVKS